MADGEPNAGHFRERTGLGAQKTRLKKNTLYCDEILDDFELDNKDLSHSVFADLGLKSCRFKKIDMRYSTFVRCYFRGAQFRECDFTGSRFVDCNFRSATFTACNLSYTEWTRTVVGADQMFQNVPRYAPHEFLAAQRINAMSRGEGNDARQYFLAQMECLRNHERNIAFAWQDNYYGQDKYKGTKRIAGFMQWSWLSFQKWFWGYGEGPFRLVLWSAATVLAFGAYYFVSSPQPSAVNAWFAAGGRSVLFSAYSFFGTSPPEALALTMARYEIEPLLEAMGGFVFLALLSAAIFRRLAVRQSH